MNTILSSARLVSRPPPIRRSSLWRKWNFSDMSFLQMEKKPIAKRVEDLKNLKSPEYKRDLLKVLGCLGLYSYIKNLHVDSQPFYDLIEDSTSFHWTDEHERLFQSTKDRIIENTKLAVPSTKYPFHIHVDSSNVGTGCILIQQLPEGKRNISLNSRVFDKAEQKKVHFTEDFVELFLHYKPTINILLAPRSRSIFIMTTNQFCNYGDAKNNSPIDFFVIRLSSQNFRTWEILGHLDQTMPSLIFSAKT